MDGEKELTPVRLARITAASCLRITDFSYEESTGRWRQRQFNQTIIGHLLRFVGCQLQHLFCLISTGSSNRHDLLPRKSFLARACIGVVFPIRLDPANKVEAPLTHLLFLALEVGQTRNRLPVHIMEQAAKTKLSHEIHLVSTVDNMAT